MSDNNAYGCPLCPKTFETFEKAADHADNDHKPTPMTQPDIQARVLAKVDEEIKRAEDFIALSETEWIAYTQLDEANKSLGFLRALRKAIERHGAEEYQLPAKFRGGEKGEMDTFTRCSTCRISFPCPELTEIAKEMNING